MVVANGMLFVSPHSALFGKQFQGQSRSPLISLGGVRLFILHTLQLFLSLEVEMYRSGKKKGQKHCRKGEAAVAKAMTRLGRQEARLAGGQPSCKPEGPSGFLSPTARVLAPRGDARRRERRQPWGIPFSSGEDLAPGHGTWRAWAAGASLNPKSGRGKEGRTVDREAAVRGIPGNAGIKPGGRNWGWGSWRWWPQGEVADPAGEVGILPGKAAAPPLTGSAFAARCGKDARLHSHCCHALEGQSSKKIPIPGTNRRCVSSWTCARAQPALQPHCWGCGISRALALNREIWSSHATSQMQLGASCSWTGVVPSWCWHEADTEMTPGTLLLWP